MMILAEVRSGPLGLGQRLAGEAGGAGIGGGARSSRPLRYRLRCRLEGGGAHGDDLFARGRLQGLDGVAGIDGALEGVGRNHLAEFPEICGTSSLAATRGRMFLPVVVAGARIAS